jgi:hypothetical protein
MTLNEVLKLAEETIQELKGCTIFTSEDQQRYQLSQAVIKLNAMLEMAKEQRDGKYPSCVSGWQAALEKKQEQDRDNESLQKLWGQEA